LVIPKIELFPVTKWDEDRGRAEGASTDSFVRIGSEMVLTALNLGFGSHGFAVEADLNSQTDKNIRIVQIVLVCVIGVKADFHKFNQLRLIRFQQTAKSHRMNGPQWKMLAGEIHRHSGLR
jgi:hypothetical protein